MPAGARQGSEAPTGRSPSRRPQRWACHLCGVLRRAGRRSASAVGRPAVTGRVRGAQPGDAADRADVRRPAAERHAVGALELPARERDDRGARGGHPGRVRPQRRRARDRPGRRARRPTSWSRSTTRRNALGITISLKVASGAPGRDVRRTPTSTRAGRSRPPKTAVNAGASFSGAVTGTGDGHDRRRPGLPLHRDPVPGDRHRRPRPLVGHRPDLDADRDEHERLPGRHRPRGR